MAGGEAGARRPSPSLCECKQRVRRKSSGILPGRAPRLRDMFTRRDDAGVSAHREPSSPRSPRGKDGVLAPRRPSPGSAPQTPNYQKSEVETRTGARRREEADKRAGRRRRRPGGDNDIWGGIVLQSC